MSGDFDLAEKCDPFYSGGTCGVNGLVPAENFGDGTAVIGNA